MKTNTVPVFAALFVSFFIAETVSRNQACMMLIGVDQYAMEMFGDSEDVVKSKAVQYVEELNKIYESSILMSAPNDNIYFQIKEIRILRNFLPDCENKGVVLSEFSKLGTGSFCLAHLLTYRDFGCVIGLAFLGGLCRKSGNTGWTKVFANNTAGTVNTLAHEVGHALDQTMMVETPACMLGVENLA